MSVTFRRVTISDQDVHDLEDAVHALYRAHANDEAVRMLRLLGEIRAFRCDVDESAGMAEVVELNGYSRKAPPCV